MNRLVGGAYSMDMTRHLLHNVFRPLAVWSAVVAICVWPALGQDCCCQDDDPASTPAAVTSSCCGGPTSCGTIERAGTTTAASKPVCDCELRCCEVAIEPVILPGVRSVESSFDAMVSNGDSLAWWCLDEQAIRRLQTPTFHELGHPVTSVTSMDRCARWCRWLI